MTRQIGINMIQGPHCIADFPLEGSYLDRISTDVAIDLVNELADSLRMKKKNDPRIIRGADNRLSIYQIVSTSHIIIHFGLEGINADLFSCEPFNVDKCISLLRKQFGSRGIIQYCQRNLFAAPETSATIPMKNMNLLTSNPGTFTHALINWFSGNPQKLGDIEYGTGILREAMGFLHEARDKDLPKSSVLLLDVPPIQGSWDQGGFSGGYVNLAKQLTIHTFLGINGAYTDIMGFTFDLESILDVIKKGFEFSFYEVDGIFQRFLTG